ncbi:hypothetical protein L873DRAFT_1831135 [Choiromyces venosus 120613-1]|uniref:J domain-containing protein n=1 Tax=Choiromyces venosus 120613-1 TaxID=1336337 RepID=A0A3N4J725_9PEZI|nr:hypothetical protein L873DRAFT_1831135 [Choiromyces venosus 120613-1]
MAPSEIDFYKVLGIGRYSTEDEIKKAFRKAAKDTHPDKNPGDPLAKEKFQDLQRAHDTLKDSLERAKYDEDNPYHGYPEGTYPQYSKTKSSGTAKRYASATQQQPQWGASTSSTFGAAGFARQSGARASAYKATHERYPEGTYRSSRSEYEHASTYRSTPKPSTPSYTDSYEFYEPRYRPESPRGYDRNSSSRASARQSTATPNSSAKTTSSSSSSSSTRARPNSTSDLPQTDSAAQTPEFNLGAYIKERRAREAAAEAAAQAEQRRQKEEEEAIRARRAEMAEHAKKAERLRKDEERLKEERLKEHERIRAELEARKAEEEARLRKQWSDAREQSSRNGYNQADPTPFASPFPLAEEDLEKKVDEELRAKTKNAASSTSRQRPRGSPTKPRPQRSHESDINGYADGWSKSGNTSDNSGGFAYPFPKGEDVNESFMDKMRRMEKERVAAEKQRETSSEQWENRSRENGSRTHSRTKSDPRPPGRRGSFAQPETARTSTPPSPRAEPESQSPRIASPRPRRKDSEFRFKFDSVPDGPARKDSYHTPEAATTPMGQESPFSKYPDFHFFDNKPPVNPFNYTTAEELFPPKQPFARPQSQPVYPTQPQHAPVPRQTPQPHAQQQHQARQQPSNQPFKEALWDTLLKTTTGALDYRPEVPTTALRSPKKKMSGSSIRKGKGKGKETIVTPDPINLSTQNCTGVKSEQCPANNSDPVKPEPMENSKSQASHKTTVEDEVDVDAMDTAPDTGVPSPTAHARPKLPRVGIGRSVDSNSASPRSPLPGQPGGLDNFGMFMNVPPLRHPNVGLENFEELKDNLPFPSQASNQPRQGPTPTLKGKFPKILKPDIRDLYEPQTPAEEPFAVPIPPKIPKTPHTVTLEWWNTLFYQVEPYVMKWNEYEGKYNDLHTRLSSSGLRNVVNLDGNTIMNYITRVRDKDILLENSFRQAREKHMQALESWVHYREQVLLLKNQG